MAARRERTTGLPRARQRTARAPERRIAGISWTEARIRNAIIGGALALLIAVVGVFGYEYYRDTIARPGETILSVGDQKFSLGYYRDRLGPWFTANASSQSTPQLLEESLLDKLVDEGVTLELGRDKGINLSNDDVTKSIAEDLGTTTDAPSFDTLYRARLASQKIPSSAYRRLSEASAVNKRLLEAFRTEVGDKGEQFTLRNVVVSSQAAATAIVDRVKNKGEELATIAQTESIDVESRTADGLLPADPLELMPASIRDAAKDKPTGTVLGPVQVEANWWVFTIEKREESAYSDAQKGQLAQLRLDNAIKAKRTELNSSIDRSLDSSDIRWAEKNLNN